MGAAWFPVIPAQDKHAIGNNSTPSIESLCFYYQCEQGADGIRLPLEH